MIGDWQGARPCRVHGRETGRTHKLPAIAEFDSVGLRYGTGGEVLRDLDFRLGGGRPSASRLRERSLTARNCWWPTSQPETSMRKWPSASCICLRLSTGSGRLSWLQTPTHA